MILKKQCAKCGIEKTYDSYYISRRNKTGLTPYCRECSAIYRKEYVVNNRENVLKYQQQYKKENSEKVAATRQKWRIKNAEVLRRYNREYISSIPHQAISQCIKSAIQQYLSGRIHRSAWEEKLSFTFEELKTHLENQFSEGMSWRNYGVWQIDHKIPISAFKFQSPEDHEFNKCWALNNLQPLWAKDNLSKGSKINFEVAA